MRKITGCNKRNFEPGTIENISTAMTLETWPRLLTEVNGALKSDRFHQMGYQSVVKSHYLHSATQIQAKISSIERDSNQL